MVEMLSNQIQAGMNSVTCELAQHMHVLVLSSHMAMTINDNIYCRIHSITTCIHMKPSASQSKTRAQDHCC